MFLSRVTRQAILEKAFGFICACSQCVLPEPFIAISDALLERYRRIRDLWRDDIRDFAFDRRKALAQLQEAEDILFKEAKEGWKSELLEQRFYVHALWGQRASAVEAGKSARGWAEMMDGKKRAWKTDIARLADRPEAYEMWGLALRDNGGVLVSRCMLS